MLILYQVKHTGFCGGSIYNVYIDQSFYKPSSHVHYLHVCLCTSAYASLKDFEKCLGQLRPLQNEIIYWTDWCGLFLFGINWATTSNKINQQHKSNKMVLGT